MDWIKACNNHKPKPFFGRWLLNLPFFLLCLYLLPAFGWINTGKLLEKFPNCRLFLIHPAFISKTKKIVNSTQSILHDFTSYMSIKVLFDVFSALLIPKHLPALSLTYINK